MCRGFDPLFSLWQDRARSFWGIFSHPPTPKRSFGVLKLPILKEFDLLGPKFHFPPPPPPAVNVKLKAHARICLLTIQGPYDESRTQLDTVVRPLRAPLIPCIDWLVLRRASGQDSCSEEPGRPAAPRAAPQLRQATGLDARASRVKWPAQFMSHWYGILFIEW